MAAEVPPTATPGPPPEQDPLPAPTDPDFGEDLLQLDRQVCFALAVAARDVIRLYRPVLAPLGLTHPQYLVMLSLWEQSPRRLKDIAKVLSLDPATLSPLLKRLEAAGLVLRGTDDGDDRALAITLTDEGRAMREQALSVPLQIIARLGMSIRELEELRTMLHRVIAAAS